MNQGYLADHFIELAKADLKELSDLDRGIRYLHDKLTEKEARVFSISASATDDIKVQTSRHKNKLEENIIAVEELKEKLLDAILRRNAVENEKKEILQEMPLELRTVIEWRYIEGKSLQQLGFSRPEAGKQCSLALVTYGRILSEKTE